MHAVLRTSVVLILAGGSFASAQAAPLIVDHNAVDRYADIPQAYIDQVKTMWIVIAGESHSEAYRSGCQMLETLDGRFQVNITEGGTPEGPTTAHLRISRATWGDVSTPSGWVYGYGEEDWYTSAMAIQRTRDGLTYCNAQGLTPTAFGFGWCWDMTWNNPPGGGLDAAFQVHWAGSSDGGPQGSLRWGLDAGDQALTGNSVCMDTYLGATQQYLTHCQTNGYPTRVYYTTGPVDGDENLGESGYQRHLKCETIRSTVNASSDGILFDYADILCWSNAGVEETTPWTDGLGTVHTYPTMHPDNLLLLDGSAQGGPGHIGERGALRLGKAVWWMLARMAGWDGLPAGGTATASPSSSATRTASPTRTATRTSTATPTGTPSRTGSPTPTVSATPTATPTVTLTRTVSSTGTVSATFTHTPSVTSTPTVSATFTLTASVTSTPTVSATFTLTPSVTLTPTVSATFTVSPPATLSPTVTPVGSASGTEDRVFLSPGLADGVNDQVRFAAEFVEVTIMDLKGWEVYHDRGGNLTWTGKDGEGRTCPSGPYIVKLRRGDGTVAYRSVVVVK